MSKEEYNRSDFENSEAYDDLFKAAQQFAKNTSLSLEEWPYDRIMFGFREDIRDLNRALSKYLELTLTSRPMV